MKICVTASKDSLDAQVDPRFGRAAYFLIVDSDTMTFDSVPNTAAGAMSGAGIQAAQTMTNKGVEVLITGNVGPNAFQALASTGIKIVVGADGTVREAIDKYKKGELKEAQSPTVRGHHGMGKMGSQGMGRGQR
ncbi:MAG: NifB/NifX family molybdenum-iron cluster-binding protein [Candidatus Bathyarchaeota archaeon]|jgi:predicted Fe-Mo cluster-binding NifX family protein